MQDIGTVSQAWTAILRRFRRRGVRAPRQLLLGHSFELVPESMSKNPAWLLPPPQGSEGGLGEEPL